MPGYEDLAIISRDELSLRIEARDPQITLDPLPSPNYGTHKTNHSLNVLQHLNNECPSTFHHLPAAEENNTIINFSGSLAVDGRQ